MALKTFISLFYHLCAAYGFSYLLNLFFDKYLHSKLDLHLMVVLYLVVVLYKYLNSFNTIMLLCIKDPNWVKARVDEAHNIGKNILNGE